MYKLIALDMDGTLLKSDKTISDRTLKALEAARVKGVKVVLATGRPVNGIKNYINYLDLEKDDEFAVTFNGSAVQTAKSGKMLFEKFLTGADLHEIYKLSLELGVHIHAFDENGQLMTPVLNNYTNVEAEINNINIEVRDFSTINSEAKIIKIMLVDSPEKLDAITPLIPKELYSKYSVMRSASIFLEFLTLGINKAQGLSVLTEELGITKDEVIAVGDAENDIEMIKYAGLGVAMGNAYPEVKDVADYVTVTNNEDGVAAVIEKFILNQ